MTSQPPGETAASTPQRIGWAILIVVTLCICYFSHLGVIGFVGPDEPRYAWIARDMAETGDWVTPRLYGKPWFEKPPLLYWGGAIFFKLLGEGHPEVAARLPSGISALFATLALAWLAWRTYGGETARWLLLLLPTSVGMIGFSHAAATDMPFAGMLAIAMVCAAVALGLTQSENTPILPHTPWPALLLFGFFLGLAVLAKGPAAIILSGGAIFFWAILTKRWRDTLWLVHPAAIASFCLTALPWYILCARRNPDFFRIFIIEHNFKRYLTPEFQHVQPFWFYVPILLVAFLPWSLLLIAASATGLRELWRNRKNSPFTFLVLSWAAFCLVFFSVSKSKLPGYVLPAVPAIALLLVHGALESKSLSRRVAAWSLITSGFLCFCATIFFRFEDHWVQSRGFLWGTTALLFVTCGAFTLATLFAGLSIFFPSNSFKRFCLTAASVLAIATLLQMVMVPSVIDQANLNRLSGKALALAFQADTRASGPLRSFGFRRDYHYALNFYLHEEVADWNDDPIRNGFVLSESSDCPRLKTADQCIDLWSIYDRNVSWGLLKITPNDSLGDPGAGRQPRQEK